MKRALHLGLSLGAAAVSLAASPVQATEQRSLADLCEGVTLSESDGPQCVSDDGGTALGFKTSQVTPLGTIETSATIASQASNALTPERLIASDTRRLGDSSRVMIAGMKARLLDDRVTLTTRFGWSDFVNRSDGRSESRGGSARMVRVDAKLVDSPALRWSVAGEMSDVSNNFFIGQAVSEGAQLALPGRRLALSSSLNWQRFRLTAGFDDYNSQFGAFATSRLGMSRGGVSLSLKSGSGRLGVAFGTGRTESRSATLEFDLSTIAPALAMDERLPAALLPKYLLLSWRGGSSETGLIAAPERFDRQGVELYGTWETPLGETGLGYWRDRRIGATAGLGRRNEQVVQLSHMVRRGNWRFGIDAMIARNSSTRGSGLTDRNLALGGSIAYEVQHGPRLMIQLSNDRGRMAEEDETFVTARRGQQISASLDLTDYLRRLFDRPDLRFKIDYRKQLDRSTTAVSAYQQLIDRWSDGSRGEGLLVSFGMKL